MSLGGLAIFIVLAIAAGLAAAAWYLTPKSDNQEVIRTSLILTIVCCYLIWALVYLAQLHPLIAPKRSDLRAET